MMPIHPTVRSPALAIALVLAACMAAAPAASAQAQTRPPSPRDTTPGAAAEVPPRATATLNPRVISTNDLANYVITVYDSDAIASFPTTIDAPGLEIAFRANSRSTAILNGRTSPQVSFIYTVTPTAPGNFVIPPQTVVASGQALTAPAVRIAVTEGTPDEDAHQPTLKLNAPTTEFFVGEIVPVEIELHIDRQTQLMRYGPPELFNDGLVIKRPERPTPRSATIDGELFSVYAFPTSLTAIRPGTHTLGPAKLETIVAVPQNRTRTPTNIFSTQMTRTFNLVSDTLTLEAKPLPDNPPPSFTGAVGRFDLTVVAKPTTLNVGDPIALDMTVSGTGSFDAVQVPVFTESERDGWRFYPPSQVQENRTLGLEPGAARFHQVVIPDALAEEVPSLELSFFDPAVAEYVTLRSEPVPLEMSPDPGARLIPDETTSFAAPGDTPLPAEEMADILDIVATPPAAWATPRPAPWMNPVFWAVQAAPLAALAALIILGARRRARDRAPATEQADPVRTPADVFAELNACPTEHAEGATRFYHLVSELFSRVPPGAIDPEMEALRNKADLITFGGNARTAAAPLDPAARDHIVRLLAPLAR